MHFTIDRSKWRCGGIGGESRGKGSTALLNEEGYMCCLGQVARQIGCDESAIRDLGEPTQLDKVILYRCSEIEGNLKLAWKPDPRNPKLAKVRVETRGEGGFVVAPGSPPETHPTGKTYEIDQGDYQTIPVITPEQRAALFAIARSFDRSDKVEKPDPVEIKPVEIGEVDGGNRADLPGDDFNQRVPWSDILIPLGWTIWSDCSDGVYWRRPGKDGPGHSAIERRTTFGNISLVCFSTSAPEPFSAGASGHKTITKFKAYSELNHGGDDDEAAADLRAKGYGLDIEAAEHEKRVEHGGLVAKSWEKAKSSIPKDPGDIPEEWLLEVPGLLFDVMQHTLETALCPSRVLAFTGALSLVAAITGRRVRDYMGTRTNLYVIALADASAGKEAARETNIDVLYQAGWDTLLAPESAAS